MIHGSLHVVLVLAVWAGSARAGSLQFVLNDSGPGSCEHGRQMVLPPEFGRGEFTFELWILPDNGYPVGPTGSGLAERRNWSDADRRPYSSETWWFDGNFLLDGHNNAPDGFRKGTFSLQFYGGGRVRWLFGDGFNAGPGGHWSVGAYPAVTTPSLLDGKWHHLTLVRRWIGSRDAQLELWVDGALIASEITPQRTDMRQWWDGWSGFPSGQEGWFWGCEKQVATGVLDQYEDYKGLLDELRFWSRARSQEEIMSSFNRVVSGTEPLLDGRFDFSEGQGDVTANRQDASQVISLVNWFGGLWSSRQPPLIPDLPPGTDCYSPFD